jgi:hypothetical protein
VFQPYKIVETIIRYQDIVLNAIQAISQRDSTDALDSDREERPFWW